MTTAAPAATSVRFEIDDEIGLITIDNPPANAWSQHVRAQLSLLLTEIADQRAIRAVVLTCAGKTFSVGADIRELGQTPLPPAMADVMRQMAQAAPLFIAAIHGQALGGGLEVALLCDYRAAMPDARFGLPEITLGLIPGAGGTQRLPRLIGAAPALDMILSGKPVSAEAALNSGLIDLIVESDLAANALRYARRLLAENAPKRRLSALPCPASDIDFPARRAAALRAMRGLPAAAAAVDAVQAATCTGFESGLAREAELFQLCRGSTESRALRYLFAAEREVAKIPGLTTPPNAIETTAVIGAGTMGTGVAIALLDAGFAVTLIETGAPALERGLARISQSYQDSVAKGRITGAVRDTRLAALTGALKNDAASGADLVIECVFEDLAVKQSVFSELGRIAKPGAVLATNTSALDIDAIAAASLRPASVLGMHFFSPANVMRLVEVVKGGKTEPAVLATAMAAAKRMNKIAVAAGMCDGFIGNRMIGGYLREANLLLFEGAAPAQIDHALETFGMAMGPHAMGDMAGLDILAAARNRRRAEGKIPPSDYFGDIADRLVASGRLGLKTGKGMYLYAPGSRAPVPDPEVAKIIAGEALRLNIPQRAFRDDEIIERCILSLVNEGAKIVAEGIAAGALDIDVIYCNGYGFPRTRGGPMFYADTLGLPHVHARMTALGWTPASLLTQLASQNRNFQQHQRQ